MDRVQVLKRESTAGGGDPADEQPWDSPIEPQEDAIETAGVFLQDPTHLDESTLIDRVGDDMRFKDGNNPTPKTLSDLLAGTGGLTESGHRILRQLIHFIDNGPAEGFTSGAYEEILPAADPFPTSAIWWESAAKLKKIVELTVTYSGPFPTAEEWKMYDTDGSTVLATITDAISYSGPFETSRTRTIVIS